MIEMLKSKSIIAFIIFMLVVTFIACPTNKLEEESVREEYVYVNIK